MPEKVIVIDDDVSLRRVLEYNLVEEGYDVLTASSGGDGVRLFEESGADVVITDLKMSGMDGFEVLKTIREKSSETQVIVITAFGAVETAVQAMKNGAFDYITKPFNRDELKLTVRKALQLKKLESENQRLRDELSDRKEFRNIIGMSRQIERVFEIVAKVADTEATVLVTGESGTGKELVARAIHAGSGRKDRPFIPINCAAIPRDLLESELFGHVKGAFTGAIRDKIGKFQQADTGTIFLDEVGELPVDLQPKLLRALQEKTIEMVGGTQSQKVDVRVVAATNADLEKAIEEGTFREDLYYRLSVIPVHLPPLRERSDDVPLLIRHFIEKHGAHGVSFTERALQYLQHYSWPGNVRELENTVERLLIMRNSDMIDVDDLPEKVRRGKPLGGGRVINLPTDGYPLEQLEKEVVLEALEKNGWNQTNAAKFLHIPRHTLIYRMEKYGITQEGKKK